MEEEFRNEAGDLVAFDSKKDHEGKLRFEKMILEFNTRVGRLESHVLDNKGQLCRVESKITAVFDFMKDMIQAYTSGSLKIDKFVSEYECRIKKAEEITLPLAWLGNWAARLIPWVVSAAAFAGLVLTGIHYFYK